MNCKRSIKNKTYKNFEGIPLNKVKPMQNFKMPIYKYKKLSNNTKYKINSKRFDIPIKENQTYVAILEIGIIKELKQQGIITEDEMITIIKQLKKKNGLEVEIK